MQTRNLTPNAVTWTTLINACGKAGQLERAFETLREMRHAGHEPNVVTWTALVDAAAKAKRPHLAVRLYRGMLRAGVVPNLVTCDALFSCLLYTSPSPRD